MCVWVIYIYIQYIHTHTHTHLFLWIVGTFHRLLFLLYRPRDIFYAPKPKPTLTKNLFALLHFQIIQIHHLLFFILFCGPRNVKNFRFYYPCGEIWSLQCSINKYTHTHTHTHDLYISNHNIYLLWSYTVASNTKQCCTIKPFTPIKQHSCTHDK